MQIVLGAGTYLRDVDYYKKQTLATIVQWDQNHGMTKKEKKIELVYCLYYLSTIP